MFAEMFKSDECVKYLETLSKEEQNEIKYKLDMFGEFVEAYDKRNEKDNDTSNFWNSDIRTQLKELLLLKNRRENLGLTIETNDTKFKASEHYTKARVFLNGVEFSKQVEKLIEQRKSMLKIECKDTKKTERMFYQEDIKQFINDNINEVIKAIK